MIKNELGQSSMLNIVISCNYNKKLIKKTFLYQIPNSISKQDKHFELRVRNQIFAHDFKIASIPVF